MLPIPTAETVLSSSTPTSNTVFGAFIPYGYMEIGLLFAALAVLFLIGVFVMAVRGLLHKDTWAINYHKDSQKFK